MARGDWHYFAEKLNGNGTPGAIIELDLPLSDVGVTQTLSGPAGLTGTIKPEVMLLKDGNGDPLFSRYGVAIWAEAGGSIRGGGILTDCTFTGPEWGITCTGFAGYPAGQPYTDKNSWNGVEVDPLDGVRQVWKHLQAQPGGDLGLIVDDLKTGLKVGTALTQDEFDSVNGSQVFESGPLSLRWYETTDLGQWIDDLAQKTPFDYVERHEWTDNDTIAHYLDFGYPRIGRRRNNLRFVVGENVLIPTGSIAGADYATVVLGLGNGDGPAMIRGFASRPPTGLRVARSVENKNRKTASGMNKDCQKELAYRNGEMTTTEMVVVDHAHAPLGSFSVGDEIHLEGHSGWVDFDMWVRVTAMTLSPADGRAMSLSVIRSDKLSA